MSTIQNKRGNKANLPASLADGELAIAKDIGELWYGTGAGRQEVSYVHLNANETIAGNKTFTGVTTLPATTSIGTVTATELSYLNGVTSALQTQLVAKASKASPTFTGTSTFPSINIGTPTSTSMSDINVYGTAGTWKKNNIYSGANLRWCYGADNVAEGGSNAGSDFFLNRYNDDGTYLGKTLQISRATGFVGINKAVPTVALDVVGAVKATDFVNSSFASKVNPTFAGRLTSPAMTINRDDGSQAILSITCTEATGVTTATGKNSGIWCNVIDCQNSNLMITTLASGGTGGKIFLDGKVGVGKTPTYNLDVDGTVFASSTANTITGAFGGNGGSNLVGLGNISGMPIIQGYNAGFAGTANVAIQPVGGNTGFGGVVDPKATVHGGGSTILGCAVFDPTTKLGNTQCSFQLADEDNRLYIYVRKADGTIKSTYLALI